MNTYTLCINLTNTCTVYEHTYVKTYLCRYMHMYNVHVYFAIVYCTYLNSRFYMFSCTCVYLHIHVHAYGILVYMYVLCTCMYCVHVDTAQPVHCTCTCIHVDVCTCSFAIIHCTYLKSTFYMSTCTCVLAHTCMYTIRKHVHV